MLANAMEIVEMIGRHTHTPFLGNSIFPPRLSKLRKSLQLIQSVCLLQEGGWRCCIRGQDSAHKMPHCSNVDCDLGCIGDPQDGRRYGATLPTCEPGDGSGHVAPSTTIRGNLQNPLPHTLLVSHSDEAKKKANTKLGQKTDFNLPSTSELVTSE